MEGLRYDTRYAYRNRSVSREYFESATAVADTGRGLGGSGGAGATKCTGDAMKSLRMLATSEDDGTRVEALGDGERPSNEDDRECPLEEGEGRRNCVVDGVADAGSGCMANSCLAGPNCVDPLRG